MIEFATKTYFPQIISLWHDVFGDTESIIHEYLDRFYKRVLIFRENSKILGMLSLLPISSGKASGFYVYAVATNPECRSQGIASSLLEYSKTLCEKNNFLLLVPASTTLFDFYTKFGFSSFSCTTKKQIFSNKLPNVYLPVTPISPTELLILRKEYFKNHNFFEWDIDVLNLMHDVFGSRFIKIGNNAGFAVCEIFENLITVKELCCNIKDESLLLSSIQHHFNCDIYTCTTPEKTYIPNAMIYGKKIKKPYFNLALD